MENIYNDKPTDVTEHHLISFEANKRLNGNTYVVLGATDIKPHIFLGAQRFLYGDSRNLSVYCCKSGSVIFVSNLDQIHIWIGLNEVASKCKHQVDSMPFAVSLKPSPKRFL